jgi:uncharacterized protein (TIGR03435 family)
MMLIHEAYGIFHDYRYTGAPEWLNSEKYDIEAKMDGSVADAFNKLGRDQRTLVFHQMLQTLLADRLKLETHRETKELPVYLLVVGKSGAKLPDAKPDPDGSNHAHWGDRMNWPVVSMIGFQATPGDLAGRLSGILGREVLDKTGLAGKYDFTLEYVPDGAQTRVSDGEGPPAPTGVSIFTALQEQLGLKLESGKGPVEIIVIGHVERPSGN